MNPIAIDRLKSQLLTTGLQQKDNPLYQVINQLIGFVRQLIDETATAIDTIPPSSGGSGAQGAEGNPGMPGLDGEDGIDGDPGLPGPQGFTGNQGIQGFPGIPGIDGNDGEVGFDGFPGPQGPPGVGGGTVIIGLKKTADQTINGGAGVFVDITDLTFPVVNGGIYAFEFYIVFRAAVTTTGWRAAVNHPGGTVDFFSNVQTVANSVTANTTFPHRHGVAVDDMNVLVTTVTAGVDLLVTFTGRYLCTANGTFAARFANELVANTDIVVQSGSWGRYF